MTLDPNQTLGTLIEQEPAAVLVLHELGIRLGAQRNETIAVVCDSIGLDVGNLAEECEQAREFIEPPPNIEANWFLRPLEELADYIIERFHAVTYDETERITILCDAVAEAHNEAHGPLIERTILLWNNLAKELLSHMRKEEIVIFPLVRQLKSDGTFQLKGADVSSITDAIASMKNEHKFSDGVLADLRTLTDDYATTPVDCPLWRAWWQALQAFDRDLRMHSHLEDDILFVRMGEETQPSPTE